jgi:hypothetical protein
MVYVNVTDGAGALTTSNNATVTRALYYVAITNVTPYQTVIGQGFSDDINVTATNQANYTETFNVTVYANATSIASQNITLPIGQSDNTILVWNTTSFAMGNYTITAQVTLAPNETDTADNTYTGGTVKVTIPGDINGDGVVNSQDVAIIAAHWLQTAPPAPANADILGLGIINSRDIAVIAANWLKKA